MLKGQALYDAIRSEEAQNNATRRAGRAAVAAFERFVEVYEDVRVSVHDAALGLRGGSPYEELYEAMRSLKQEVGHEDSAG